MAISKHTSAFAQILDKRMMDIWMKNHPIGPNADVRCFHCKNETFSIMLVNTCPHCAGKGVAAVPVSEI
jgi:hypothetical protein